VLVATAHAQLLPPPARRSDTAWPEVETPASPEAEITAATAPRPDSVFPQSTLKRLPAPAAAPEFAADFAADLFNYLAEPESDAITPHAELVISDGKVIELERDWHVTLGTSAGQIRWAGSGGFAAYGRDRFLWVHGDTFPLIWGKTTHFIGASDVLVFGTVDSDATLIWDKKIDLGGGPRTIRLIDNPADRWRTAVRFNQGFTNGDLVFEGIGVADLSAANNDWQGNLTVNQAELRVNVGASLHGLYSITIEQGARFVVDNLGNHASSLGGHYLENRLSQFTTINLNSGAFSYLGQKSGNSFERTGIIELLGGANVIDVTNYRPGQSTVLTLGGLYRDSGATLNLTNSNAAWGGAFGTGGYTPQLKFRDRAGPWAMPELEGGILPWATVNGEHFATLKGKHLVAYTDYYTGDPNTWEAPHNASLTTHQYLSTDRSINSLRFAADSSLQLDAHTKLTLNAGALLSTGGDGLQAIHGGELLTPERELLVHVYKGWFSIHSNIRQTLPSNSSGIGLVKSGDGTLVLESKDLSALRGDHYLHEGTLILARRGDGIGLGGHLFVGNGGRDGAKLELYGDNQLQRSASLTLRGNRIREGIFPDHSNTSLELYSVEQYLDTLTIEGACALNFANGPSVTDLIGFDHIVIADNTSELIVYGWEELTKHLLIHRSAEAEIAQYLGRIKFGYDEDPAHLIDYNADYFEIVPTWYNGAPEPGTTGAVLAAGALGFFAWRRRRVANKYA